MLYITQCDGTYLPPLRRAKTPHMDSPLWGSTPNTSHCTQHFAVNVEGIIQFANVQG